MSIYEKFASSGKLGMRLASNTLQEKIGGFYHNLLVQNCHAKRFNLAMVEPQQGTPGSKATLDPIASRFTPSPTSMTSLQVRLIQRSERKNF